MYARKMSFPTQATACAGWAQGASGQAQSLFRGLPGAFCFSVRLSICSFRGTLEPKKLKQVWKTRGLHHSADDGHILILAGRA